MSSTLKAYKYSISLFLVFLLGIVSFEWVIWGQDGLSLWMPIIAEYLRGTYENSPVIFGGQNLLAIYGALPFWKVLSLVQVSPVVLLNLTYYVLIAFFFVLTWNIYTGMTRKDDTCSQLIIFIYCLLSPIILNRVFSGHFNLLFGMLPFLVSLGLIYNRSRFFSAFCIFVLCCSFCIQGYQLLAYHFFYLPILILWLKWDRGEIPVWYLKKISLITLISIILSSPIVYELISHSKSADNLRDSANNVVYSYLVSLPSDIGSLFMSSVNKFTSRNAFFLFHELNYPVGLTAVSLCFLSKNHRKILISVFAVMMFVFAFSANWPIFNLVSKLPLMELFRVPQRSLMLGAYVVPLFFLISFQKYINPKSLFFLLIFVVLGNGLPLFELLALIFVLLLLLSKKWNSYPEIFFALIFSTLFLGLPEKYVAIRDGNHEFVSKLKVMRKVDEVYELSKRKQRIHLEGNTPMSFIMVANYLGIPTAEGYGHPPKSHFTKVQSLLPIKLDPMTNVFFLNQYNRHPNFTKALKSLGIERIVIIGDEGKFTQFPLP